MFKPIECELGHPKPVSYSWATKFHRPEMFDPLTIMAEEFWENSAAHGFYEEDRSFDRALMLITGEVSEAHEEFRSGHKFTEIYYRASDGKPEGIPTELADILIRVLDTAYNLHIDIAAAVAEKHAFNRTRPHKHGRDF